MQGTGWERVPEARHYANEQKVAILLQHARGPLRENRNQPIVTIGGQIVLARRVSPALNKGWESVLKRVLWHGGSR